MSIKKSMLALAVAAMATMAFASSAMATDGKIRDVTGTGEMGANRELHAVGWAKFETGSGSYECHVTSIIKSTNASTGTITKFDVPDTTKCTGGGVLGKCKLTAHEPTNLPWHVTITDNGRIDVTGTIVIHIKYKECVAKEVTLTFDEIQLTPLSTVTPHEATGTAGRLGVTAALNEPIAGIEIDASSLLDEGKTVKGTAHVKDIFGGEVTEEAAATGESELSSATERCTWEISAT